MLNKISGDVRRRYVVYCNAFAIRAGFPRTRDKNSTTRGVRTTKPSHAVEVPFRSKRSRLTHRCDAPRTRAAGLQQLHKSTAARNRRDALQK